MGELLYRISFLYFCATAKKQEINIGIKVITK